MVTAWLWMLSNIFIQKASGFVDIIQVEGIHSWRSPQMWMVDSLVEGISDL
jgi:hypothetical protein